MRTRILSTSDEDIAIAGKIIAEGGLVAFPTETVYGLGANALRPRSVRRIYEAKGRPSDNPLIVHVAEKEDIIPLVREIPPKAQMLIDRFFPAPLTIILPKSDLVTDVVSGGLSTVAIRMPQSEVARKLIKAAGCPIAAPSANTSGLPSPTRAKYVKEDLNGKIRAIIDGGDCTYGLESTVISLAVDPPVLYRPGAITVEMIEEVIGDIRVSSAVLRCRDTSVLAPSPGMKYKHYSPKATVILLDGEQWEYERFVNAHPDSYALCFKEDKVNVPRVTYGRSQDELSQARGLFNALRKLDEMGAETVYARMPAKDGVSMAVYNRLIRAAAYRIIKLPKPFTIGLTGLTGSGKGYVAKMFAERGFNVISCDEIAREIVEKDSPILRKLVRKFGKKILQADGELNRQMLAQCAFDTPEHTQMLNSIMHSAIMDISQQRAGGDCVLDAPQLFEANADKRCDFVVSVLAPADMRLKRVLARDGITAEEALLRMSAQLDEEYLIEHSDFTITNDGRDIAPVVDEIIEKIKQEMIERYERQDETVEGNAV